MITRRQHLARRAQRGFTLIELMIVVAIIGILATVALPLLVSYLTSSKGTEGDLQIENIENLAKKYYYKHNNQFPQTAAALTPAADCCSVAGTKMCKPDMNDWNAAPWTDMHFKMTDKEFRFQYDYTPTATGYVADAQGDLDCDPSNGITKITTTGTVVSGEPSNAHQRTDEN